MTEPTPTPKPKTPSASDDETVVLASMIYEKTAAFTAKLCYAAKLDPEAMFTDTKTRDNYFALKHQGPSIFAGYLSGVPVEHIAAADDLENRIRRIVRRYKRKLAETDRTLDTFETPGPDKDDPDCLFQNRWLRRGACGAIVSTSGVGKSSFSMQAATVWAGGQECLGVRPLHPLKIGVFQSEDDEYDVANFRDRIRIGLEKELGWTADQIHQAESRVTFCALDGSTGARFVEYVRHKQTIHRFDLIIINPLFAFFGADLNEGAKMTEFLRHGIDPLIKAEETKCGCIIIHHTGKPNRDAMKQGDIFKAYLGSGSGEFTNYIRSALVLTPWNNGKLSGVFDLIAAKHSDKLGWRDADGKPTTKKTVCYANKLPEYAASGMIFWVEPDEAQFSELKKAVKPEPVKANQPDPIEKCAQILAEHIRTNWTPTSRPPTSYGKGQKSWATHLPADICGHFKRATKEKAYAMIEANPTRFNLKQIEVGTGRTVSRYFVALEPTDSTATNPDNLNPEQEDLF